MECFSIDVGIGLKTGGCREHEECSVQEMTHWVVMRKSITKVGERGGRMTMTDLITLRFYLMLMPSLSLYSIGPLTEIKNIIISMVV